MLLETVDLGQFFIVSTRRTDIKPNFIKFVKSLLTSQISIFIIIFGRRGTGKTDLALLISEIAHYENMVKHFATNTRILGAPFKMDHISNLQDLEYWGKKNVGRKIFVFDEIANAMSRRRPMAGLTVELIKKFNTLRKHKLTIIATTISESVLDKAAMDSDLLDGVFRRPYFPDGHPQKCKKTRYINLLNGKKRRWTGIPATTVQFDSWDSSVFTEKPLEVNRAFKDKDMEIAYRWANGETYTQLNIHPQQLTRVKKKILKILIEQHLHASHVTERG